MTVLIIDRDQHSTDQITAFFDQNGIEYEHTMTRDLGMEKLRQNIYEAVILDPAPQNEIRPFVMAARRMAKQYPYIMMTSHTIDEKKALSGGCNDLLVKPADLGLLAKKLESARHLTRLIQRLDDESEDFPSKGGIIAKSAYNQLFISCLDRADRYGEQSYLIFVKIKNFADIVATEGSGALAECADALKKYLARIRRLSDIAGQIATYEFSLLLLRPAKEDEPFLAVNRFAETLRDYHDLISLSQTPVEMSVSLLSVPSGEVLIEHSFNGKSDEF